MPPKCRTTKNNNRVLCHTWEGNWSQHPATESGRNMLASMHVPRSVSPCKHVCRARPLPAGCGPLSNAWRHRLAPASHSMQASRLPATSTGERSTCMLRTTRSTLDTSQAAAASLRQTRFQKWLQGPFQAAAQGSGAPRQLQMCQHPPRPLQKHPSAHAWGCTLPQLLARRCQPL
jgi:hypothetical protein